MWLLLAFGSAALLGFYDASKKIALKDNAVLPVLLLNTFLSTLIFSPAIVSTAGYGDLTAHLFVLLKAFIVLSSWICGYFGLKHLPITIVGPINATRPVLVLAGAALVFGERLNLYQWTGVILAIVSIFLLSISSRKEAVDFKHNRWVWCVAAAAVLGAVSGLYDKFIVRRYDPLFVQGWFNLYQLGLMALIVGVLWYPRRRHTTPFHWSWAIPFISIFLCAADYLYFNALAEEEAMISVVSLVRRGSVLISFACGVVLFKERNLKAKVFDLLLILLGMVFIWLGSR